MSTTKYIEPRRLESLGSMRLRARAIVEGLMAGMHRNPHRGSSVEFAEYKEYHPGDDIRHIDWRAYGRIDRYYVKQFEDETDLRAYLCLDTSGSMDFAGDDVPTKALYAGSLVASLAYLLIKQGDAPGLLVFDERPGFFLPPSGKRSQLEDICRVLEESPSEGRTRVETAFSRIAERVHRRSMVVLVSDMLDYSDDMLTLARVLRRRGMEVVVFHIIDPAEAELPYEGLSLFEGMEGEGELLADPDDLREVYKQEFRAHADQIRGACQSGDIEYFRLFTSEPVETGLQALLTARSRRGRR